MLTGRRLLDLGDDVLGTHAVGTTILDCLEDELGGLEGVCSASLAGLASTSLLLPGGLDRLARLRGLARRRLRPESPQTRPELLHLPQTCLASERGVRHAQRGLVRTR